jgi:membrane fusion protein (multidrug efflux system)
MATTSTPIPQEKPQKTWLGGRRNLIIGATSLLVLLGGSYFVLTRNEVSTDDAQVDGHLIPISPKISGYISDLLVNDNQIISKGQLIVRIDPRDEEAKVAQAQARLAKLEAQSESSSRDVNLTSDVTRSAIESAEASLANAEAELARARATADKAHHADMSYASANVEDRSANNERAHSDLLRMQALIEKHEISKLQYDRYVATERMAKSQLHAAQESVAAQEDIARTADAAVHATEAKILEAKAQLTKAKADRQQVGIRTQDATAMRGSVDAARASLEAAKLLLSYTEIRAPRDGKVTRRTVEAGAYVSPGQTLLTLVPTRDIWVTANFKETQLRHVRAGDRVDIEVDQLGKTFSGIVDSVAEATGARLSLLPPENATGNFVKIVQRVPVKILLDADAVNSGLLSIGDSAEVTIHTR